MWSKGVILVKYIPIKCAPILLPIIMWFLLASSQNWVGLPLMAVITISMWPQNVVITRSILRSTMPRPLGVVPSIYLFSVCSFYFLHVFYASVCFLSCLVLGLKMFVSSLIYIGYPNGTSLVIKKLLPFLGCSFHPLNNF